MLDCALYVSKETSYSVKRDLLQCQKRPTAELARSDTCQNVFFM